MSPPTPSSTSQQPPTSRAHLSALLKHKLRAIPPHHLPTRTLDDILLQSSLATHIPTIPPDIQLAFFLRHRAQLALADDRPLKSHSAQNIQLTRAIWFYRLDSGRQFQRYHDGVRWNLAMFVALLAISSPDASTTTAATTPQNEQPLSTEVPPPRSLQPHHRYTGLKDTYIPLSPSGTHFITLYIAAVLEHHNTPLVFRAREAFIQCWKSTRWDMFTVVRATQKKVLKREMKRLGWQWELLLDDERKTLGKEGYERTVGRFIGCVVPGRKDQGVRGWGGEKGVKEEGEMGRGGDVDVEGDTAMVEDGGGENGLLDGLRVPFQGQSELSGLREEETSPVTELRYAITAVQKMHARDILPVLMKLFPVEGEEKAVETGA